MSETDVRRPSTDEVLSLERAALLRVAAAANANANDLPSVLELAAEEALNAIGAASLTISRFEDGQTRYRPLINVGELAEWEERFPEDEIYEVSESPRLIRMAETGKPSFDSIDDPSCDEAVAGLLRSLGKTSDIEVAILVEGDVWGGLWASTSASGREFRAEDIQFLEAVAGQLGGAIARAELFAKVSRLAYEDSLTGLANRRAFDERLERATARFAAGGSSLALLLCDLDGLKAINDGHGHETGDSALQAVAAALVAAAAHHPGAFVARLGGDEFCVLLETQDEAAAGEFDSIEALGTSAQQTLRIDEPGVSISCGVATAGPQFATPRALLRAADSAQYAAKRRGGNRICTAAGVTGEPEPLPSLPLATNQDGLDTELIAAAAESVTRELNNGFAEAPVLDRLELIATRLTRAGRFAYWTISFAASGTDFLRDLSIGDTRNLPGDEMLVARSHEDLNTYALDDYPLTASLIQAGSGSFLVEVGDEESDPAERRLLEREGFAGVVGAVSGTDMGVFLVEIFSDDRRSLPLRLTRAVLSLAVAAAMPPAPHRRVAGPVGNVRALELSLALADRLTGVTEEEEVFAVAVDEIHRAYNTSAVHLVAVTEGRLALRGERGPFHSSPDWTQAAEKGLIGRAIRDNTPVVARDVSREPQYRKAEPGRDTRSELVVPISVAGEIWGAVNLEDPELGAFSPDDARLLESVAAQIGGALTAIHLYARLYRAYAGTAEALSEALEAKDPHTAQCSCTIADQAAEVGRRLGMEGEELRMLRYAAAFHDIGKLGIPREVLNKPGTLDQDDWAEVVQHTLIGERILAPIEFLEPARAIVRSAHERWDGGGYPDHLVGEAIPLGSRILFACDAYDAMTSDRSYSPAKPDDEAREELRSFMGVHFDPQVVEVLLTILEEQARGARGELTTGS